MDPTSLNSRPLFHGVVAVVILIATVQWVIRLLAVRLNRRRIIREYGCLPIRQLQNRKFLDRPLGIKRMLKWGKEIGNGTWHETMRKEYFQERKTFPYYTMLEYRILTIEPENVKTILATRFDDFGLGAARKTSMISTMGHGIFTTDGRDWESSRALVRPSFIREKVANMNIFEYHIQNFFLHIPKDGSTFDIQDLFFKLTMDTSTEYLFGHSTNTLAVNIDTAEAERFAEAFTSNIEEMCRASVAGGLGKLLLRSKYQRNRKLIHRFADNLIHEAIQRHDDIEHQQSEACAEKTKYIFLPQLLRQTRDPFKLRSEILNILLAGRDTTAGLLANIFWVLARKQDVWARLQSEISSKLQGRLPDYDDIKSMTYLRYVINESLRLYPAVPTNGRVAFRDTVLPRGGGPDGKSPLFIPKGTHVSYMTWSMHRMPEYFGEDALDFNPDRWETLRPTWEYLPFNGGPRICVGQQFALLETSYTLIRIMQTFGRLEPRSNEPWRENWMLTLAAKGGVHVALHEH